MLRIVGIAASYADHLSIASPTTDLAILYTIDSTVESALFDLFSPFIHIEPAASTVKPCIYSGPAAGYYAVHCKYTI